MNILDYFYTNPPKIENFYPRKFNFPIKNSFKLVGARGVGKSAIIINYLMNLKKDSYLYLDCQDPIFILEFLDVIELEKFIKHENIELLVLDHYFEGFLENLPKVNRIIIISNTQNSINLPLFTLFPLDFEEFLNFSKKQNSTSAFNIYTKRGSLPKLSKSSDTISFSRELFFEKFEAQEGKVLLILAIFHAKITTPNQIYLRAKDYFKISKDWLYKTIKNFEKEGIIYKIETLEKGFGKKLLLYDFAFSKYLNKYQSFLATIDSIIALALIKHNINIKAIINPLGYLTDKNELILISPFESEETTWSKIQKNFGFYTKLNPKKVTIVTVSNSYNFKINNLNFNAIPFSEWLIEVS